jgi:metal-responsive CopG/Arc/MetJ family transcriptional regulator
MGELTRGERLQIMLSNEELAAVDDWRFQKRMPSRASAIRELLRRGLAAEGFLTAKSGIKSKDYGVIENTEPHNQSAD